MAKRFTDTEKWKKIRDLSGDYKLLYNYICDDCDHAGVWIVDFDIAGIYTGKPYDLDSAVSALNKRIHVFDNGRKWYIKGFIEFQYPGKLNPKNKCHKSIIKIIEKYKLDEVEGLISSFSSPLKGAHEGVQEGVTVTPLDKDKDKELDKDTVKEAIGPYRDIITYLNKKRGTFFDPYMTIKLYNDIMKFFKDDDFYKVIDNQIADWGNDSKFRNNINPTCLFKDSVAFEKYLNNIPVESEQENLSSSNSFSDL